MSKKIIYTLLFSILLFNYACQQGENNASENSYHKINPYELVFSKGKLGEIEIGMSLKEVENKLNDLTRKEESAKAYGFEYGRKTYVYYKEKEILFGLIPKSNNDSIEYILVFNSKITSSNKLHSNSSVSEIVKATGLNQIKKDQLNHWEYMEDKINNWNFIFITDAKSEIGKYPNLKMSGIPQQIDKRADWILLY